MEELDTEPDMEEKRDQLLNSETIDASVDERWWYRMGTGEKGKSKPDGWRLSERHLQHVKHPECKMQCH